MMPYKLKKQVRIWAVTKPVPFGTPAEDLDIPETVTATLDDDSTEEISVEWDAAAVPPYDGDEPGDYVWGGTLVDLPEGVTNPDDVEAQLTVTVGEPDWFFVEDETDFDTALNRQEKYIVLTDDLDLLDPTRIEYDMEVLDLNNFNITLSGGVLAFRGDGTEVKNGSIFGDLTWWDWATDPGNYLGSVTDWETWQYSNRVMVSGAGVTFDNVDFHVDIADWYQEQGDKDATGLTIKNSALHGFPRLRPRTSWFGRRQDFRYCQLHRSRRLVRQAHPGVLAGILQELRRLLSRAGYVLELERRLVGD